MGLEVMVRREQVHSAVGASGTAPFFFPLVHEQHVVSVVTTWAAGQPQRNDVIALLGICIEVLKTQIITNHT